jgi:hypothetical protein
MNACPEPRSVTFPAVAEVGDWALVMISASDEPFATSRQTLAVGERLNVAPRSLVLLQLDSSRRHTVTRAEV